MAIGPKKDIGRDLKVFAASQASFATATNGTTAGENYPEAGDAIRVITATGGGSMPFATREDKFGTATYVGGIQQKLTSEASLETYLMVNGTPAQVPDIGPDLLEAGGWAVVDTSSISTTVSSGTNATVFVVGSATGFVEGGGVAIEDNSNSDLYHLRRIVTVASTTITVEPALPATPTSTKNIKGCTSYKPDDSRDGGNSDGTGRALALFVANNRSLDQIESFMPTSFAFSFGGDSAARLSVSGTGRITNRMLSTTVTEPIDAVEEYFNVADGAVFEALNSLAVPAYYQIDDEIVKCTAVAAGTVTVVRDQFSSGAATHADGSALVPMGTQLAGTYTGGPVAATSGAIYWSQVGATAAAASLQMTTATVECGFGVTTRDNVHGTNAVVAGYTMNTREVNLAMSGWTIFDDDLAVHSDLAAGWWSGVGTGTNSQQIKVVVQQGAKLGKSVAMVAPAFRPTFASLDRGSEEVTLETAGICEGTSSGADEILLIFS